LTCELVRGCSDWAPAAVRPIASVSLTHIFQHPVEGRHFFDRIIRDHLELGRPDHLRLLFDRRITRATPAPQYGYRTRVITADVNRSLHVRYKTTDIKQVLQVSPGASHRDHLR